MSAQPASLHAQLRLAGVRVSASSHCIVHASHDGAASAAQLLAAALAQMHPHAAAFEPLAEAAYLKQKSSGSDGSALRLPIVVGRCEDLLRELGWQEALGEVSAAVTDEQRCDWSVSTHTFGSNTGLLFLGAAVTPAEEARNLLAAVFWFAKEILACDLLQLLEADHSASAGAVRDGSSDGRASPKPNALMNLVRLHVRHRYIPAHRASLGLAGDPRLHRLELVRHTQSMELVLDGENSDMTIDLSQATEATLFNKADEAAVAPAAVVVSPAAEAAALPNNELQRPPSRSPSPSPSPSPPVLPPSLDPHYVRSTHAARTAVPKKHTPHQPLHGSVGSSTGPAAAAAAAAPFAKPMLAVDLDEVLGDFVPQLVLFHNERYGTRLRNEHFHTYHFANVWGGTNEESQEKVQLFFDSHYFADLPVVAGAQAALQKLRERFDLTVVTSRQHFIEAVTRRWLERHFPGTFNGGVFFGNHYGTSGVVKSKPAMCAAIGAVALVDDSLTYARQCAHTLERVFLFGNYAWNQLTPPSAGAEPEPLPCNVVRCAGWAAVMEAMEGWNPEARAPESEMAGPEPE